MPEKGIYYSGFKEMAEIMQTGKTSNGRGYQYTAGIVIFYDLFSGI